MRHLILFVAVPVFFANCTQHYFYAPNTLHIPTVREKGDMTAEISLNGSNQIKGFEAKAAYCPVKNTSVMVNYMYLSGTFNVNNSFVFPPPPNEVHSGSGFLTEVGITRNFVIDQYKMFTLTAGGSLGRSVNDYDRGRLAKLNFNRFYLQPAIVSQGELAEFGVGLRFSRLGFYKGRIDYRIDENDLMDIVRIDESGPFWIPDIGLSAGINFAPVHLKCNLALSVYDKLDDYSFSGNNLNIAMLVDVDNLLGKNDAKKTNKKKSKKKKRRH